MTYCCGVCIKYGLNQKNFGGFDITELNLGIIYVENVLSEMLVYVM